MYIAPCSKKGSKNSTRTWSRTLSINFFLNSVMYGNHTQNRYHQQAGSKWEKKRKICSWICCRTTNLRSMILSAEIAFMYSTILRLEENRMPRGEKWKINFSSSRNSTLQLKLEMEIWMNSSNMKHLVIHSCFPGDKSELIPILKRLAKESEVPSDLPGIDGLVIKGAVIVN